MDAGLSIYSRAVEFFLQRRESLENLSGTQVLDINRTKTLQNSISHDGKNVALEFTLLVVVIFIIVLKSSQYLKIFCIDAGSVCQDEAVTGC